jgi:HPt (histidine-containing phosphotransfer) domain-containing protein
MATGIKVANHRFDLYVRLLRNFIDSLEAEMLQQQLMAGDFAGARLSAHTLKGVAGTIGAPGLRTMAATLENYLKAIVTVDQPPTEEVASHLATVAGELDSEFLRLSAALRIALPVVPLPAATHETNVNGLELRTLVDRLDAMLATDDMASQSLARDNAPLLRAGLGAEAGELLSQIADFAFDEALVTLRAAAGKLPR